MTMPRLIGRGVGPVPRRGRLGVPPRCGGGRMRASHPLPDPSRPIDWPIRTDRMICSTKSELEAQRSTRSAVTGSPSRRLREATARTSN